MTTKAKVPLKNSTKYLDMRCNIDEVFEHYAKQSETYKRSNVVQRFQLEDRFYHLTIELLKRIIGPFKIMD